MGQTQASGTARTRNPYGFTAAYCARLIYDFYQLPGNLAGGPLHIVTDDNNIEDDHLDWCIKEMLDGSAAEWHEEIAPGVVLGWILRQLTRTQRGKANRIHNEMYNGRL